MSFARQMLVMSALSLVFLSVCQVARAVDCDKYASDAVAADKFNWDNRCGFRGDAWSADYEGHKMWCIGAPPQDAQRESDIRGRMIWACQNLENDCLAYSEVAVAQQWANKNRHGYNRQPCEGDAWNDDQAAHERWCLRVSPEQRRNETSKRGKQLNDGGCHVTF